VQVNQSGDDEYDTQLFHETYQTRSVPQEGSWCTQNSTVDDTVVAHSSANGGLRQTRTGWTAQLTARRLQLHRQDFGRLQAAGGAMNAMDHALFVINRGVRKIISFARQVPGFETLIVNDQICLIKRQFATVILPRCTANYY